jgi:hypothetical protein
VTSALWVVLALASFVVIPIVAARSGMYKRVVAVLLVLVAGFFYLAYLSVHRIALDRSRDEKVESWTYEDGLFDGAEASAPFVGSLIGPITGLALLVLVPTRRED